MAQIVQLRVGQFCEFVRARDRTPKIGIVYRHIAAKEPDPVTDRAFGIRAALARQNPVSA